MVDDITFRQSLSTIQFLLSWQTGSPNTNPNCDFGHYDFSRQAGFNELGLPKRGTASAVDGKLFQLPFGNVARGMAQLNISTCAPVLLCFGSGQNPTVDKNDYQIMLWPNHTYSTALLTSTYDPRGGLCAPLPVYFNLQKNLLYFRAYVYQNLNQSPNPPPLFMNNAGSIVAPALATATLTFEGK